MTTVDKTMELLMGLTSVLGIMTKNMEILRKDHELTKIRLGLLEKAIQGLRKGEGKEGDAQAHP